MDGAAGAGGGGGSGDGPPAAARAASPALSLDESPVDDDVKNLIENRFTRLTTEKKQKLLQEMADAELHSSANIAEFGAQGGEDSLRRKCPSMTDVQATVLLTAAKAAARPEVTEERTTTPLPTSQQLCEKFHAKLEDLSSQLGRDMRACAYWTCPGGKKLGALLFAGIDSGVNPRVQQRRGKPRAFCGAYCCFGCSFLNVPPSGPPRSYSSADGGDGGDAERAPKQKGAAAVVANYDAILGAPEPHAVVFGKNFDGNHGFSHLSNPGNIANALQHVQTEAHMKRMVTVGGFMAQCGWPENAPAVPGGTSLLCAALPLAAQLQRAPPGAPVGSMRFPGPLQPIVPRPPVVRATDTAAAGAGGAARAVLPGRAGTTHRHSAAGQTATPTTAPAAQLHLQQQQQQLRRARSGRDGPLLAAPGLPLAPARAAGAEAAEVEQRQRRAAGRDAAALASPNKDRHNKATGGRRGGGADEGGRSNGGGGNVDEYDHDEDEDEDAGGAAGGYAMAAGDEQPEMRAIELAAGNVVVDAATATTSWKACPRCRCAHDITMCCNCGPNSERAEVRESDVLWDQGRFVQCYQCQAYCWFLKQGAASSQDILESLERSVRDASASHFLQVSAALLHICERRLFECIGFASFVDYVRRSGRVPVGVRQAHHLVAAARFVRALPAGSTLPSCERQARPLSGVAPTRAAAAWALAQQRAAAREVRVTGALVAECVRELAGGAAAAQGGGEVHTVLRPVFLRSGSAEWWTPDSVLELVRELFAPGRIDLDPCSTASANVRVGAGLYYDAASDGLVRTLPWRGSVFVNPPFGLRDGRSLQGLFFERSEEEYRAGNAKQVLLVLKAGVGYAWFPRVLQWPVCFLHTRLSFVRGGEEQGEQGADGGGADLQWGARAQNPHGSVAVYLGPNVERFVRLFGAVGSVPGANSWALQARPAPLQHAAPGPAGEAG